MKISPIAGPGMGAVSTGSQGHSPDRVAAAKAAFMGQDPSTIQQTEQPAMNRVDTRRITMKTNHSPELYVAPTIEEDPQINAQLPPSGDNKQDNPTQDKRPISPQLAALAREKRQLQVMKQELEAEKKALLEKASSGQSVDLESFKSNWLDILLSNGMTYEQLIETVAAKGPGADPGTLEMKKKIAELENKLESTFKDRDAQAEQQVLTELRKEANRITAQGDEFEAIRATRSQGKIVEFIEKQYRKTGELLDTHEAAKIIENILVDDALKQARLNKVKSKLMPEPKPQAQPVQQNTLKTLTSRHTATPATSRKARALAAFNGTLKG